jgi:hypothetical protein
MGFSTLKYRKEHEDRPWKINPVWRGIGCIMILIIPIMAWYATSLFLQSTEQIPFAQALDKPIVFKFFGVTEVDRIIADFNNYTVSHNLIVGQFLITFILILIGLGVISLAYSIIYWIAGPPRYGPFDVPPDVMRK